MEIIKDFDKIEPKGMEDFNFKTLPIGAYECIIKDARIHTNKENGKETLKVSVDIASGEYKDYFQKRYDNNNNSDKKWDNNAVKYLSFQGENVSYFKGFITCVINSNVGYKWNWDETSLKNKKICGIFQYEEYQKLNGSKAVKVRLSKFRSLDKLKEIKIPKVKKLDGSLVEYEDYKETKTVKNNSNPFGEFSDLVEITDNLLD